MKLVAKNLKIVETYIQFWMTNMEIIFYNLNKRCEYNFYNGSLIIKCLTSSKSLFGTEEYRDIPGSPFFPRYFWKDPALNNTNDILTKKYLIIYHEMSFYEFNDDNNKYTQYENVEVINLDDIEELKDKRLIASLLE